MDYLTDNVTNRFLCTIEKSEYIGMNIAAFDIVTDDALIEDRMHELLNRVSVKELDEEEVQKGDTVEVVYSGEIGSDSFENCLVSFTVGDGTVLEPFEAAVLEKRVHEKFMIHFPIEAPHLVKSWENSSAHLEVTIQKATHPTPYILNDEYVASVSDFESVEALKEAIRCQYEWENEQEINRVFKGQVSSKIGKIIKEQVSREDLLNYAERYGADYDPELVSNEDSQNDGSQNDENLLNMAAFEIGWRVIAKQESLFVDDMKLQEELSRVKRSYDVKNISEKQLIEDVRDVLLCDLVTEMIIQNANIKNSHVCLDTDVSEEVV